MPQISIIMPVRNGGTFLPETVESILSQTFEDFELIAVDGGSTDDTLKILPRYKDSRIKVIEAPGTGIVKARNIGIEQSQSPWIACNDADDVSLPDRLQRQWDALQRTRGAVLSYTDVEFIGERNIPGHARLPRTQAFLAIKLCHVFPIVHSTMMFRREVALKAGGYEGQICEDYRLTGRLAECGVPAALPQKLLKFRLTEFSASQRDGKINPPMAAQIGKEHCQRYMRLSAAEAERCFTALINRGQAGQWREWSWFLRFCVPRLPWNSLELQAWLALQTLKLLKPGKSSWHRPRPEN